jgi:hypothetical protein
VDPFGVTRYVTGMSLVRFHSLSGCRDPDLFSA